MGWGIVRGPAFVSVTVRVCVCVCVYVCVCVWGGAQPFRIRLKGNIDLRVLSDVSCGDWYGSPFVYDLPLCKPDVRARSCDYRTLKKCMLYVDYARGADWSSV